MKNLKIGDKIKILSIPEPHDNYYLHRETRDIYEKIIKRNKPVKIYDIDKDGIPWFYCKFKKKDGTWHHHYLSVDCDNWKKI